MLIASHPTRLLTTSNSPQTSSPVARKSKVFPAAGSKTRPVIYLKRGRGGKVGRGGRGGGRGCAPVADESHAVSNARDNDVVSTSSGQTTSEAEAEA